MTPGLDIAGTFDIETEEWDRYVTGGLLLADGTFQAYRDPDDLVRELLTVKGTIWTWNGGRYDTLWLLDRLRAMNVKAEISLAGQRITMLRAGSLVVRDGMALFPTSLAKAAGLTSLRKSEVGLACSCARGCGGYCRIRRGMTPADYRLVETYLEHDCQVTLAVMRALLEYAERNQITLRGTVGGSAWATCRALAGAPQAEWAHASMYALARRAYFGGRCEVFKVRAPAGHRYDINSAYPAALASVPVPVGEALALDQARASRAYRAGTAGAYTATVIVPEMDVPPLPWRAPTDRVCYPVGRLSGTWMGNELEAAELLGVGIVQIHSAIVWTESAPICKPFVDHVWSLRAGAGKGSTVGAWLKWLANSLTGKLAQDPDGDGALLWPTTPPVACPGDGDAWGRCTRRKCSGRCRAWTPLDRGGALWSVPRWRIPDCGHIQWAATLTAACRGKLADQLRAGGGGGDAIYCDTDSCYSTGPRTRDIGPELGEWQAEGELREWWALAPKTYAFEDGAGSRKVRAKGLPGLTWAGFETVAAGGTWTDDRGVMGLKSAARAGGSVFRRKVITRRVLGRAGWYGSRQLVTPGVNTRASTVAEIVRAEI